MKTTTVAHQSATGYVGDDVVKVGAVYLNDTFKSETLGIAGFFIEPE